MTRVQGWVIVLLIAVLGGTHLVVQLALSVPPPSPRWEYQITFVRDSGSVVDLNRAGALGWELVSARRANEGESSWGYECIMRRPR